MRWRRPAPAVAPARGTGGGRIGLALAVLLAMGPLATIGGAHLLATRTDARSAAIERQLAPRRAAAREAGAARALLAPALARPALGQVIDRIAAVLPADAMLVSAAQADDGRLVLEFSTPDPDALRAALRRAPGLAALRDSGQRRTDASMMARLEGPLS